MPPAVNFARLPRDVKEEFFALLAKKEKENRAAGVKVNPWLKYQHDAVAAVDGVHSESEGVEPSRRVVVLLD